MDRNIKVVLGDITDLRVDAIVNAANTSLLGGGGVDGAIHSAAGPELVAECRTLGGCDRGEAKITKGYNLPARFVIHTVGPSWKGGFFQEREMLESCYRNCMQIASDNNVSSIAFSAISTGVYGYPVKKATEIAITQVHEFLDANPDSSVTEVIFACFSKEHEETYEKTLQEFKVKS